MRHGPRHSAAGCDRARECRRAGNDRRRSARADPRLRGAARRGDRGAIPAKACEWKRCWLACTQFSRYVMRRVKTATGPLLPINVSRFISPTRSLSIVRSNVRLAHTSALLRGRSPTGSRASFPPRRPSWSSRWARNESSGPSSV